MERRTATPALTCTLIAILIYCAGVSSAEESHPSFDCAKANSSAEELICADASLAALDRRMATRFKEAMQAAGAMDAGAQNAQDTIKTTQRGWIKGRDDCWKSDDLRACVMASYLMRENELVTRWMLQDPVSVVSYSCNANRANEVTAMFFDTELPSVRLEYGDEIDSGSLSPTASGSKYIASFGRSIWIKGTEATVVWPEGNDMSCVLVK